MISFGKYKEAIEYFEKALKINLKAFGDKHPKVAENLSNMGKVYNSLGNYEKSKEYIKKALGIYELTLGKNHPETEKVRNILSIYSKK
jgi:tetratricopeptide (TPR) repeat protein